MTECICTPAPPPYDHLLESHPKCIAHVTAVRLVAAGWKRDGGLWTHDYYKGLWTEEQAKETLDGKDN
jgi:hypothetical protein